MALCRFKVSHFPGQVAGPGVGVGPGWEAEVAGRNGRSLRPAGTSLALGDKADSPQPCRHCHYSFLLRTLPHGSGKTQRALVPAAWLSAVSLGGVVGFSRCLLALDHGGEQKPGKRSWDEGSFSVLPALEMGSRQNSLAWWIQALRTQAPQLPSWGPRGSSCSGIASDSVAWRCKGPRVDSDG